MPCHAVAAADLRRQLSSKASLQLLEEVERARKAEARCRLEMARAREHADARAKLRAFKAAQSRVPAHFLPRFQKNKILDSS